MQCHFGVLQLLVRLRLKNILAFDAMEAFHEYKLIKHEYIVIPDGAASSQISPNVRLILEFAGLICRKQLV